MLNQPRAGSTNVHELGSWRELAAIVDAQAAARLKGREWIFRGVGSKKHDLVPSIGRPDARKDPKGGKAAYSPREESEMLDEFKRRVRPYLVHIPDNDFEWLAVGQHHGLATRLLDWSLSPLIATYFAVETKPNSGDKPVLYGIENLPLAATDDPFAIDVTSVYRPPHISPRIPAQMAVFTASPRPTEPFTSHRVHRWVIHDWFKIKVCLDAAGINRASLSPGIDGTAEYVRWRYKWGWLSGQ